MSVPRHLDDLPGRADHLDRRASEIGERGSVLLRAVADAYRQVVTIYESDPTLVDCPAGRERDLDLAVELCRQLTYLVHQALDGRRAERWPIEGRWQEAEALAGRLPEILGRARAVARPDHATPEGSRAISRLWLTAAASYLEAAGGALLRAVAKARSLPNPDPEAESIAALAQAIILRAEQLSAEREAMG